MFLEAARRYRAMGLHPIPVEVRGKRPALPTWREYCDRQPTEQEIEQWWTNTPDANVALVLGRGCFAIDIDGPEGEAALALAGVVIPKDAPVSTTGKGRHVFLAGRAGNAVGVLEKVDVRSDGGYVVAPPSIHPSGAIYRWAREIDSLHLLPDAPAPLVEILHRPTKPIQDRAADGWLAIALAGAGEGQRDITCTRLAGYLLGKGVPAEATESLLLAWADRCTPPFSAEEVHKCVASIARREGEPEGPVLLRSLIDIMPTVLEGVRRPVKGRATGVPALDYIMGGGLQPGELTYLGGRPSSGKSLLAGQIARNVGRLSAGVLIASREMTVTAMLRRMLAQESGVKGRALRDGKLVEPEWVCVEEAAKRLVKMPLFLTSEIVTVDQLAVTLANTADDLGLVIVDYLQLLRGPADMRANQRASIEYVSEELKNLSVKHNIPMLVLSSLTRPPRDAGNRWRPILQDLRESGELEHDADNVLFLHWDRETNIRELIVAKQREGELGTPIKLVLTDHLTFEAVQE